MFTKPLFRATAGIKKMPQGHRNRKKKTIKIGIRQTRTYTKKQQDSPISENQNVRLMYTASSDVRSADFYLSKQLKEL